MCTGLRWVRGLVGLGEEVLRRNSSGRLRMDLLHNISTISGYRLLAL